MGFEPSERSLSKTAAASLDRCSSSAAAALAEDLACAEGEMITDEEVLTALIDVYEAARLPDRVRLLALRACFGLARRRAWL